MDLLNYQSLLTRRELLVGASSFPIIPTSSKGQERNRTLTVDIMDVEPWGTLTKDGTPRGILVALTYMLSHLSGLTLNIRIVPLRRATQEVATSAADLTLCLACESLQSKAVNAGSLGSLTMAVHTRDGLHINTRAEESLRIGSLGGDPELSHSLGDQRAQVLAYNSPTQLWQLLVRNRVDAIAGVHPTLLIAGERVGIGKQVRTPAYLIDGRELFIWAAPSNRDASFVGALRSAAKVIKSSGYLEELSTAIHVAA